MSPKLWEQVQIKVKPRSLFRPTVQGKPERILGTRMGCYKNSTQKCNVPLVGSRFISITNWNQYNAVSSSVHLLCQNQALLLHGKINKAEELAAQPNDVYELLTFSIAFNYLLLQFALLIAASNNTKYSSVSLNQN